MKELNYEEQSLEKLTNEVVLKAYQDTYGTKPRKSKTKNPWYWNSKGLYQKAYDKLYTDLVPPRDEAKTVVGEVLRLLSKAYYRVYNDGDAFPSEVKSLARAYVRGNNIKWKKVLVWA